MPISFSEQFHIDKGTLDKLGVFDAILDVDTRVFIDPALLPLCQEPEFTGAKEKVIKYFSNIISLMRFAHSENDMFWKKADKLLTFREMTGTCLGYAERGTAGNAIGPILRNQILITIKELLITGEVDPAIFELLGVIQEGMGCDRISDLITFILRNEIISYTQRIIQECALPHITNKAGRFICVNPYNGKALLLLPRIVMSPLPVSKFFDDIDCVCAENQRVRDEINKYADLGRRRKLEKSEILELMRCSIPFRDEIVDAYKSYPISPYDFFTDKSGEYIWYRKAKECTAQFPLDLQGIQIKTYSDAYSVVKMICKQFANLIENNGLYELLYDSNGKPKHESAAQLLYFGIADSYCKANDLDLIREGNNGRGPVDFKLSRGTKNKALVEVKLTSNNQLLHGIQTQLPIYMKQENVKKAMYLIIDNGHEIALKHFINYYNSLTVEEKGKIEYMVIDATPKKSASKA